MWQGEFEDKLRIRFYSHHSKCAQCIRHRIIIRKLGHCAAARRSQMELLEAHLARQYRDRQTYWATRDRSRLSASTLGMLGEFQICGILDSMDAQKHSWPRSQCMYSKEFASFNRPRLSQTSLLIHGFGVTMALTPHTSSTNSSRSAEILAHGFTRVAQRVDMSKAFINIQGDNCTKEVKNNCILRLISMWTCLGKISGGQMSFLSSGHSHEDIDNMFNLLRAWIEANKEIHTPQQFHRSFEKFFEDPNRRPDEPDRKILMMSTFRDWNLEYT